MAESSTSHYNSHHRREAEKFLEPRVVDTLIQTHNQEKFIFFDPGSIPIGSLEYAIYITSSPLLPKEKSNERCPFLFFFKKDLASAHRISNKQIDPLDYTHHRNAKPCNQLV